MTSNAGQLSKATAPDLWKVAGRSLFKGIVARHLPWIEEKARELNMESVLRQDGSGTNVNQGGAYLVIAMAQTEYWREKAKRLDTEEGRARERREVARYYARIIHKWSRDESAVSPVAIFQEHGATFDGDSRSLLMFTYDWLEDWHDAGALRRASGYKLSRFREHIGEITKHLADVVVQYGIRDHPSDYSCGVVVQRSGRTSLYFWPVALLILAKTIQNAEAKRRAVIAESVWYWTKRVRDKHSEDERTLMLGEILRSFGAKCA